MNSDAKGPCFSRLRDPSGADRITLSPGGVEEHFFTVTRDGEESPEEMLSRAAAAVAGCGARILCQDVLGMTHHGVDGPEANARAFGEATWPVTWIENRPGPQGAGSSVNDPLCGTQIWAMSGAAPEPLSIDGKIAGSSWTCHGMRWCRLGGLRPPDRSAPRTAQAHALLEKMEQTLKKVGMDFGNVARTWFFFDDILAWYNDFNRTRDAFFRSRRIFDGIVPASTGIVPASTGIGGADAQGGALSAGLLALAPLEGGAAPRPVPSPLQCPAIEYGSSFSRAVEIDLPGHKRLFVSGTASIDPDGKTQHVGDTDAQVERTLDVVEAILDSRGARWHDVTRAIVYYKDGREIPAFAALTANRGIDPLPALFLHNDVCWDDLLFEIEVDAVVAR